MTHRVFEGFASYASRLKAAGDNTDWVRLPHSKRAIQAEGGKLYFTGEPCKRAHISPRNEHGDCTQCHVMRLAERRNAV